MGQCQARRWRAWVHRMARFGLAMVFTLGKRELARIDGPRMSVRDVVDPIASRLGQDPAGAGVEGATRSHHQRRKQVMLGPRRKDLQTSDVPTLSNEAGTPLPPTPSSHSR